MLEAVTAALAVLLASRALNVLITDEPISSFVGMVRFHALYFGVSGLGNVVVAMALHRLQSESLMRELTLNPAEPDESRDAFRAERDLWQMVFRSTGVIMLVLDRDGIIRQINQYGASLLGHAPDDLMGQDWFALCLPQNGETDGVRHYFNSVVLGECPVPDYYENQILAAGGRSIPIAWHNVILRDVEGRIIGTLSIGTDITLHQEAKDSLQEAARQSAHALSQEQNARKEQRNFLAMVTHEFRSPLAVIAAAGQLVERAMPQEPMLLDEIGKINRATKRLTDMIDVLLADERMETHLDSVVCESTDLSVLLAEVCGERQDGSLGGHVIRSTVPRLTVMVDPPLFRLALGNLIDNAVKYSPKGAPILVDARPEGDWVLITVSDKGRGIAPEDVGRVFEKFFRSTRSIQVQGAGLGLYIVRRIVEMHGGSISVESELGKGTQFRMRLPLGPQAVPMTTTGVEELT